MLECLGENSVFLLGMTMSMCICLKDWEVEGTHHVFMVKVCSSHSSFQAHNEERVWEEKERLDGAVVIKVKIMIKGQVINITKTTTKYKIKQNKKTVNDQISIDRCADLWRFKGHSNAGSNNLRKYKEKNSQCTQTHHFMYSHNPVIWE